MATKKGRVTLLKGKFRYFYHIESSNGQITSSSQKYFSKSNARRAAKRIAAIYHVTFVDLK